ncbi:hypothetical protein P6P35_16200, partial [Clostridium perfringens]|nr:hypothetical protein [Clostridium perfringens]
MKKGLMAISFITSLLFSVGYAKGSATNEELTYILSTNVEFGTTTKSTAPNLWNFPSSSFYNYDIVNGDFFINCTLPFDKIIYINSKNT